MKRSRIKKFVASTLTLLMIFSISIIDSTKLLAANDGGVWVNGVNIITASNNTVQCGSGTAVYNSSTNTLTLNNATITERNNLFRAIDTEDTKITIVLVGNNTIRPTSDVYPIYSDTDITLSGEGALTAESGTNIIYSLTGSVTIDGTTFNAKSSDGAVIQAETGINIQNGAKLDCEGFYFGFYTANNMNISASTVKVSSTDTGEYSMLAVSVWGTLNVENNSRLTASSMKSAVFSGKSMDISNSYVSAESKNDVGISANGALDITGETEIISKGGVNSETSVNITPVANKTVDVFVGDNENNVTLLNGAPFADKTNLLDLNIKDYKYFYSKTHTHTSSTTWSKDDTNHWHECTANDGEKMDLASHTFGDWGIDTPVTETTKGSKHRDCTVCGQRETVEIPAIGVTPEKPTITAGAGSTYQISNGKDMALTCSGKLEDLTGIYVDGKLVDPTNYTLKSGSTILTLKASYLDTLSVGKHTLKFQYEDNVSAETDFTITTKAGVTPPKPNSPQTGDTSSTMLYLGLIVFSSCVAGVGLKKKKTFSK